MKARILARRVSGTIVEEVFRAGHGQGAGQLARIDFLLAGVDGQTSAHGRRRTKLFRTLCEDGIPDGIAENALDCRRIAGEHVIGNQSLGYCRRLTR